MTKIDELKKISKNKTILGIGPVSKTVTEVAINLANKKNVPILLIPSRRQVETQSLGGGYVFNTEDFVKFVKERDVGKKVLLARDHGGPKQGANEDLSYDESYKASLTSFEDDIKQGFDILHLDPSLAGFDFETTLSQVNRLFNDCEVIAKKYNKNIIYEIGTDAHETKTANIEEFRKTVRCAAAMNKVGFVVGNTGTFVKEMFNLGSLDYNLITEMVKICNFYGIMLKEHNLDYLNFRTLKMHPLLGIHSSNVAPEFGTEETKFLLQSLLGSGMYYEYEEFIELAVKSQKWSKWMLNYNETDHRNLATICGHYIMEQERVKEIKAKLNETTDNKFTHDLHLHLESVMVKYLNAFNWITK